MKICNQHTTIMKENGDIKTLTGFYKDDKWHNYYATSQICCSDGTNNINNEIKRLDEEYNKCCKYNIPSNMLLSKAIKIIKKHKDKKEKIRKRRESYKKNV